MQRIKYIIESKISDVYSKTPLLAAYKVDTEVQQQFGPEEHFVVISGMAFCFGQERPDLERNQPVTLTIEAKR